MLEFGMGISPKINQRIRVFFDLIREANIPGIIEAAPGFRTLLIYYNPMLIGLKALKEKLREVEERIQTVEVKPHEDSKKVTIPVVYGGEFGPDLDFVAQFHGMYKEDLIELFQKPEYSVYMYGLAPGHPLLAALPRKITTPRLKTPRSKVPVGTIGIGNRQIGIYTHEAPGGLQLIGRTPLKIYEPKRKNLPLFLDIGDMVKFKKIDEEQYRQIAQRVESNKEDMNCYIEG